MQGWLVVAQILFLSLFRTPVEGNSGVATTITEIRSAWGRRNDRGLDLEMGVRPVALLCSALQVLGQVR